MPAVASGTHTLPTLTSSDIFLNKTIPAWQNNLSGVEKFPSVRKSGSIPAGAVPGGGAGVGLMNGYIDMPGIPTRGQDITFGSYWRYSTSTTQDTLTGVKMPTNCRWAFKEFLPYIRTKFRLSSVTSSRFYFGWSWNPSLPASDIPLANSESGVIVGWDSNDSNVTIYHNSGTSSNSSSPSTTQTTVTKSSMANQVRQLEINFTAANSCTVRILDGNDTTQLSSNTITTNLPADAMAPSVTLSNTSTNNIDMDFYLVELDQLR